MANPAKIFNLSSEKGMVAMLKNIVMGLHAWETCIKADTFRGIGLLCSRFSVEISTLLTSMTTAKTSVTGYYWAQWRKSTITVFVYILHLYSFSVVPGNCWHVCLINHLRVTLKLHQKYKDAEYNKVVWKAENHSDWTQRYSTCMPVLAFLHTIDLIFRLICGVVEANGVTLFQVLFMLDVWATNTQGDFQGTSS